MESIAIIGMGCRFPDAKDPESFWSLLQDGRESITEIDSDRWDIDSFYDPEPNSPGKMNTRQGGFLENFTQFDPSFFDILPEEAKRMDPHQRLVLEVAWESLENAGLVPAKLAGSQTGVFIGISQSDYNRLLFKDFSSIDGGDGTNTYLCFAANRLSYFLNLSGPSLAIDTACSSSLVAVHLACQSLRHGECNLAFAGGVNLLLSPEIFIALSHKGMLSSQGHCKTFDVNADGFARGEGCGIFVLKRLDDAIKDGDNILATIRGSAVNQNGFGRNITAPNGLAQQELIRQALKNAGVKANEISYVEAHGTASYLGDSIEFQALKAVLMEGRTLDQPCWLTSVKSNIGHLEAAAGIASLIKVVLSLQHQKVPPSLNLKELNPYISLEGTSFSIPTDCQSWIPSTESRLAGVSSFGFGGTNCHIILEEAPRLAEVTAGKIERPLHLLTLSAKSEKALQELASRYEEFLTNHPQVSLADVCFSANTGRSHFPHRLVANADSTKQLSEQLRAFAERRETTDVNQGKVTRRKPPNLAFLFPREKSLPIRMGKQLYQTQPTFRATVDRCEEILQAYLDKPVLECLDSEIVTSKTLRQDFATQAALFSLEYALAELWKSWGIKPSAVMGHGVGEYVAACVAEVFSLEDCLKLMAQRGQWKKTIAEITFSPPKIEVVSGISGKIVTDAIATPDYWLECTQETLKWDKGIKTLHQQKCELFVEIGFSESLTQISHNYQPQKEEKIWQSLLVKLRELYIQGVPVDWCGFDRDYSRQRLQLPNYPFQRQRCWFNSSESSYANGDLFSPDTPQTPIIELLKQGDTKKLAQLLTKSGNFSAQKREILSELLDVLVQAHQKQRICEVNPQVQTNKIERLAPSTPEQTTPESEEAFVAPRDELEQQLTEILQEVLGVQPIGVQDNFFELGGDSLIAVHLFTQIEQKLGVKLPLAILFQASTVEQLANILEQEKYQINLGKHFREPSSVNSPVLIKTGSFKPPLFLFHDADGEVGLYLNLARHLDSERPVYGLRPYGQENFPILHTRISDMATYYSQKIRTIQPKGPYFLGGLCAGGVLAFETACQLQAQGEEIGLIALLDAPDVQVKSKKGRITQQRLNRFSQLFKQSQEFKRGEELFYVLKTVPKKVINTLVYEFSDKVTRVKNQLKVRLYRHYLDNRLTLPKILQNICVRTVYGVAAQEYLPRFYQGRVALFRATETVKLDNRSIDDTPVIEKTSDPLFGWSQRVSDGVEVYDVPGGHSSCLQEPYVQVLAQKIEYSIRATLQ